MPVSHAGVVQPEYTPCRTCMPYVICRDGAKLRRGAVDAKAEPMAPLPPGGDAYEWFPRRCQLPPLDRSTVCRRLGGRRVLLVGDSVLQQVGELCHECYAMIAMPLLLSMIAMPLLYYCILLPLLSYGMVWPQVFYSLALTLGAAQGTKVQRSGVHSEAIPTPPLYP